MNVSIKLLIFLFIFQLYYNGVESSDVYMIVQRRPGFGFELITPESIPWDKIKNTTFIETYKNKEDLFIYPDCEKSYISQCGTPVLQPESSKTVSNEQTGTPTYVSKTSTSKVIVVLLGCAAGTAVLAYAIVKAVPYFTGKTYRLDSEVPNI